MGGTRFTAPPGQVIGTPGAGLIAGEVKANRGVLRAGVEGERRTAAVLDRVAGQLGGPTVLHDVRIPLPGVRANIDHVVVAGRHVWLLDSKQWAPGFYWTVGGRTFRGWKPFRPAEKKTLVMAHRAVNGFLSKRVGGRFVLHTPVLVLWPSSSRTVVRTWAMRLEGSDLVLGRRLDRWLGKQVRSVGVRSRFSGVSTADPGICDAMTSLARA